MHAATALDALVRVDQELAAPPRVAEGAGQGRLSEGGRR
jgi:hypothetical protein